MNYAWQPAVVRTKPPLTAGLLAATILVSIMVAVRIGFQVNFLMRLGSRPSALHEPRLLVLSVLVPITLAICAVVMIALVFTRTPAAKPYGITICALALAYQLFTTATTIWTLTSMPSSIARGFPTQFVVLAAANLAAYTLELVMLAAWKPRALPPA